MLLDGLTVLIHPHYMTLSLLFPLTKRPGSCIVKDPRAGLEVVSQALYRNQTL